MEKRSVADGVAVCAEIKTGIRAVAPRVNAVPGWAPRVRVARPNSGFRPHPPGLPRRNWKRDINVFEMSRLLVSHHDAIIQH